MTTPRLLLAKAATAVTGDICHKTGQGAKRKKDEASGGDTQDDSSGSLKAARIAKDGTGGHAGSSASSHS
jgi:hypothetical protein